MHFLQTFSRQSLSVLITAGLVVIGGCGRLDGLVGAGTGDGGHADGGTTGGATGGSAGGGSGGGFAGGTAGGSAGGTAGAASCGLNSAVCSGACTVTTNDPQHCGGCSTVCAQGQVCAFGACAAPTACPERTVACAGRCVDFSSDNQNCDGCGNACPAHQGCVQGACIPTVPVTGNPSCVNGGPPVVVADTDGGTACTGNLAQVSFRWGVCSCESVFVNGLLKTEGLASTFGGGVGANGAVSAIGLQVGGTLWTGHALFAPGSDPMARVGGELHVAGDVTASWPGFSVASSAWVSGTITVPLGSVSVGGTLYTPATAPISGVTAAQTVSGPVVVPPPCDCSPNQLIDIAGIIRDGQQHNDNALIGLDPAALADVNGASRIDLDCGRYSLSTINNNGDATIAIHGRVALFVGGDAINNGTLQVALDPQATLDLFIGGDLLVNSPAWLGSTLVPKQLRLYVGGTKVSMNGASVLAGNFYAPRASVGLNGGGNIYGAVFSGSYTSNGPTTVRYDQGILSSGLECGALAPDAGSRCDSCNGCGNQACVNGACGACASNADCCSPLICYHGSCVDEIN